MESWRSVSVVACLALMSGATVARAQDAHDLQRAETQRDVEAAIEANASTNVETEIDGAALDDALLPDAPDDQAEPSLLDALNLSIHGFASQGAMVGTGNNFLTRSTDGSFEFSEVGLNFTTQITDRLRAGFQLFARDLGPTGNYDAKFDWFYLDYRFTNWLGVRAGRMKLPFGLYNEVADTDSARAMVLLPTSVYPTENRDFLLAQTGIEVYGYLDLDDAGALEYRAYGGTIHLDQPPIFPGPLQLVTVDWHYVIGGRLMWETPLEGLRVGATAQALRFDLNYLLLGTMPVELEFPVEIALASAEYVTGDLVLAVEYSRWHAHLTSNLPAVFPETEVTNERYYAMASYRLATWLQVAAYYAALFPDDENRKGRQSYRHDVALALRFDLTDNWLLKLEGHYFHGTADLNEGLNGGTVLRDLETNWSLFLAKTTVYF